MQLALIYSMTFNLLLMVLTAWLLRGWLREAERANDFWDAAAWEFRRYNNVMHHLRKANKGCRRLNRLVKRVRRGAERREKIYAALIDGAEAEYGQPIWPDVKQAQTEQIA